MLVSCESSVEPNGSAETNTSKDFADSNDFARRDSSRPLRLPIEDFTITPAEDHLIDKARIILTNECLERLKKDYALDLPGEPSIEPSRRYGVTDIAVARRFGYHVPSMVSHSKETPAAISPAQRELLFGERRVGKRIFDDLPPRGCYGEAESKINQISVPESAIVFAQRISMASFEESLKDSRVMAVNRKWASCMAEQNYEYSSPLEAMGDPEFHGPTLAKGEKGVAMKDMSCKTETGLLQIWSGVEGERQREMIRENPGLLKRLHDFQALQLKNAREVISPSR